MRAIIPTAPPLFVNTSADTQHIIASAGLAAIKAFMGDSPVSIHKTYENNAPPTSVTLPMMLVCGLSANSVSRVLSSVKDFISALTLRLSGVSPCTSLTRTCTAKLEPPNV